MHEILLQTAPSITVDTATIMNTATQLISALMPIAVVGIAVSIGMRVFRSIKN